jgi:hypothetical protein
MVRNYLSRQSKKDIMFWLIIIFTLPYWMPEITPAPTKSKSTNIAMP